MLKMMTLLLFLAAAVTKDRQTCRIPNGLLAAGAVNGCLLRLYEEGWPGIANAAAGALLPLILCGWLFVLSMLGAGDVKLLMTIGIYLGPSRIWRVLLESFLIGAGMAIVRLAGFHMAAERAAYFLNYFRRVSGGGWKAYMDMAEPEQGEPWLLHFSVPIMLAVIFEGIFT